MLLAFCAVRLFKPAFHPKHLDRALETPPVPRGHELSPVATGHVVDAHICCVARLHKGSACFRGHFEMEKSRNQIGNLYHNRFYGTHQRTVASDDRYVYHYPLRRLLDASTRFDLDYLCGCSFSVTIDGRGLCLTLGRREYRISMCPRTQLPPERMDLSYWQDLLSQTGPKIQEMKGTQTLLRWF